MTKKNIYDKPLIHPIQNMGEDLVLIVQIILRANRIGYLPKPLYHYFSNSTSISKEISYAATINKWNAINENIKIVQNILIENDLLFYYKKDIIVLKEKSRHFILKPLINNSYIRKLWIDSFPEINLSFSNTLKNNLIYILVYTRLYPFYLKVKFLLSRLQK